MKIKNMTPFLKGIIKAAFLGFVLGFIIGRFLLKL